MIRSAILLALCVVLAGCHPEDLDRTLTVLEKGSDAGPDTVAFAMVTPEPELASSSEEAAPVVCEDYLNRAAWYDCHGNFLRYMD